MPYWRSGKIYNESRILNSHLTSLDCKQSVTEEAVIFFTDSWLQGFIAGLCRDWWQIAGLATRNFGNHHRYTLQPCTLSCLSLLERSPDALGLDCSHLLGRVRHLRVLTFGQEVENIPRNLDTLHCAFSTPVGETVGVHLDPVQRMRYCGSCKLVLLFYRYLWHWHCFSPLHGANWLLSWEIL